jgi:hypothetical protein
MDFPDEHQDSRLPPPSIGEIGRTVNLLQQSINQLRLELSQTYVRQDVWQQAEQAAGMRVGEVLRDIGDLKVAQERESGERKKDNEKIVTARDADRRLIFTALIAPIITGVFVAMIVLGLQP